MNTDEFAAISPDAKSELSDYMFGRDEVEEQPLIRRARDYRR